VSYAEHLSQKRLTIPPTGIPNPPSLNPLLFDFQQAVTTWALRRGRSALFLDTGLGKTWCAIEWARVVSTHTARPVLILTPLAVARQFVSEGVKLGVQVNLCRTGEDISPGVNVLNYDRLESVDCDVLGGVVLDESSILKNFNGSTRTMLVERMRGVRFKLCASATPAPNDHTELGNHAEFLGVMTRVEMLSMFFAHDGGSTSDWRLKGHAVGDFWQWVAGWAIAIRNPADIGFDGSRYVLPRLNLRQVTVDDADDVATEAGMLLGYEASTLTEQRRARKSSVHTRVEMAAAMANGSTEPWLIWCDLNDESAALAKAIPDAVEVTGSMTQEQKESGIWGFIEGRHRVLVSKPSIAGAGLNMQRCADVAFVGLGHSWEQYYQAIRRVYRFGQMREVNAHIITSRAEGRVVASIERKQADADRMAAGMVDAMRDAMTAELQAGGTTRDDYNPTERMRVPEWLTF
jgi:hypothetical protein